MTETSRLIRSIKPIQVLLATLFVTTTACGNSTEGAGINETTMTIEQANIHVEQLLTQSLKALPGNVNHKIQYQERSMDCPRSGTDSASGRVLASLDYQLTNVDKDTIPEYFNMLRKWWESHNYKVLKDEPRNEYLWVEHKPDGFRMALQANDLGELYLGATSPCVWPNGTPAPEG